MITIYESKTKEEEYIETSIEPIEPEEVVAKREDLKAVSTYARNFLGRYEKRLEGSNETLGPKIKVSEVLGKLARLYERIRTTIEYKGEHVLRRNAIERILKRLVWAQENILSDINSLRVSETLIKELIWARYLPNGKIPQAKIGEVDKVLSKYLYLLENLDNIPAGKSISSIRSWIWGIASSELEDLLDPSNRELYVQLMYEWFTSYFEWEDEDLPEYEKDVQIYLAIHRAYTKSDESIMRYHLLLKEFPNWNNVDKSEINQFVVGFPKIYHEIENHLNFKGRFILYRKIQKEVAAFEIFQTIAKEEAMNLDELISDKGKFKKKVIDVCEVKYKQIKDRVNTGVVRSIIYIFATKVLLALMIEVPYEIIRFDEIRYLPLSLNIMLPPVMMWIIGLSIKIPGAKNTQSILERLESVIYEEKRPVKHTFSTRQVGSKSRLLQIFGLLYVLLLIAVFGGISYLLWSISYTVIGIFVFYIFVSLVVLFAFRIRFNANELKVDTEEEGILDHLMSYLTLPFLNLGFYLSRGLAKLNFLTIILDFIIEAPLKSVIEIFEEWTSFLRRKREEVVEVPE